MAVNKVIYDVSGEEVVDQAGHITVYGIDGIGDTVNKVVFGQNVLIDITDTTADEAHVLRGYSFHKADGSLASGTAENGSTLVGDGGSVEDETYIVGEGGITPSGSQTFTQNGTYDVTNIAEAVINVSGGGSGEVNYKETVDVVYDNKAGTTSMAIPLTNTSKDNYVVSWAVVETGVYSNSVLTMDSTPTIPNSQNMPFNGTSVVLTNYQNFTGKTGTTSRSDYGVYSAQYVNRASVSSYALSYPLTKTSTGLTLRGQYSFGKSGYYIKYRCIVYGWND